MATLLAVAVPVLLTVFATHAWAGQRVALVIGNGSYAHAPSLANPLNDTTDIGAALDRLGFKVTRIDNGSRAELWDGLQKFSFAASASEMAVVFYAGHGIEVDKRNFLVPVDARLLSDADVEFEAVPMWSSRRCRCGVRGGADGSALPRGGRAQRILAQRERTLRSAWSQHPERFVHGTPKPQSLPKEVWINPLDAATTPQIAQ